MKSFKWIIYDLGHTGFTMIVMAMLFPILFNQYYADGLSDADKTSYYGLTLGIASIVVAVLSPFLATFAQASGLRMKLMRIFAGTGIAGMAALYCVNGGDWLGASLIYIFAAIGFYGANLFYDSLLLDFSNPQNRHIISGAAFSVGYVGGVILLFLIGFWTLKTAFPPQMLFVVGAAWWLIFALPLLLHREQQTPDAKTSLASAFGELKNTTMEFWRNRQLRYFILAYFLYIDGVGTVVTSAVRYGNALGFSQMQLFIALLLVQIFGIPCALIFGWLGKKFGAKPILLTALAIYVAITFFGATIPTTSLNIFNLELSPMFILAIGIGMVQGGVQALSRSYFSSIVPAKKEVAFFGFYSMIGRCSTVIGPFILSAAAIAFDRPGQPLFSTRAGFACLSLLFVTGALFLICVPTKNKS
ncbi:MAG: MFS transporter [Opitutales bacterium]|nr:MFS transporter [Opitutales bacterium]